jgi:hypothetical protein
MSRTHRTRIGRLRVVPVTYRTARGFLRTHGRHGQPQGHKFSIGLATASGNLAGVAMVGRPAARDLDDGRTAELTGLCTDSARSAYPALLAAAWRIARAMGYHRMITYLRADEPGIKLRAAGWRPIVVRTVSRGDDRPARRRRPSGTERTARALWQVAVADTTCRHAYAVADRQHRTIDVDPASRKPAATRRPRRRARRGGRR